MKRIYKYTLQPEIDIDIPTDGVVLSVQLQDNKVCVWVLLSPDAPLRKRKFRAYGTGHEIPDDPGIYLGTVVGIDNYLVFHIFEEEEE